MKGQDKGSTLTEVAILKMTAPSRFFPSRSSKQKKEKEHVHIINCKAYFFLFSFSGKKNNILLVEVRHRRPFANDSTIKPVLSCFWKLNATSPSIQSTEQQNYSSTTEQSYDQHFTNTVHQLTANKCLISAMFLRKGFFS